jgi:hypothetical protein
MRTILSCSVDLEDRYCLFATAYATDYEQEEHGECFHFLQNV